MPEATSSSVGLLAVLVVIVLAGVIAVLLWLQARDRRQIASLLERLEHLESTRAAANGEESAAAPDVSETRRVGSARGGAAARSRGEEPLR